MGGKQSFYKCKFDCQVESKKLGSTYQFQLSTDEQDSKGWMVNRSLKDFHEFRLALARKFPDIPESLPFIKLVGGLSQQEKETNNAQILNFIQNVIRRTDVMTSPEAARFFDLPEVLREEKPQSEELMNPTDMKMNWPISHFHFSPSENIFVVAASDLDDAAQLAKEASTYNWPCCQKSEAVFKKSASQVKIAQIDNQSSAEFSNLKQWSEYVVFTAEFNKAITAMHWNDSTHQLGLGFANGLCAIFEIDFNQTNEKDTNDEGVWYKILSNKKYRIVSQWQRHMDRISGIQNLSQKKNWLTTSFDKNVKIVEVENDQHNEKFDVQLDVEAITSLYLDNDKKGFTYVGSQSGLVFVLDLNSENPQEICRFSASIDHAVSSIYLTEKTKYIFVATKDMAVSVFEPIQVEKNVTPYRIAHLQGKAKITNLDCNPQNKDIYASDTAGNLTVWGAEKFPKYAWTAHKKAILCMKFIPELSIIITSSKDHFMNIWKITHDFLPESWAQYLNSQSKQTKAIGAKLLGKSGLKLGKEEQDYFVSKQT